MKLYYAPGACSLAVHIALRESGRSFDLEKVDLRAKRTERGEDYTRVNPKGYVPALKLDDGSVFTEAGVCLQYVADLAPQTDLAPVAGSTERYRLMEWLNFISTEIHKTFGPFFDPTTSAELRERQTKILEKRFAYLSEHLGQHRRLMGDKLTIADAYLFTVLNWTKVAKIDTSRWPALEGYVKSIGEEPSVRAALKAEGLSK
jgi:glutathione S-transferase